jgi:hypothetical protein
MNRKFHHKVIDIAIKAILVGIVAYGVFGGIYFAATKGIVDFGFYI